MMHRVEIHPPPTSAGHPSSRRASRYLRRGKAASRPSRISRELQQQVSRARGRPKDISRPAFRFGGEHGRIGVSGVERPIEKTFGSLFIEHEKRKNPSGARASAVWRLRRAIAQRNLDRVRSHDERRRSLLTGQDRCELRAIKARTSSALGVNTTNRRASRSASIFINGCRAEVCDPAIPVVAWARRISWAVIASQGLWYRTYSAKLRLSGGRAYAAIGEKGCSESGTRASGPSSNYSRLGGCSYLS